MKRPYHIILLCCLSSLMFGCASTKEKVFADQEMKTMEEIYKESFGATKKIDDPSWDRIIKNDIGDLSGYTRSATNELTTLFPMLPNPKMSMFVFPHVTTSGLPVPGYTTNFHLYTSMKYAMPGEIREPTYAVED